MENVNKTHNREVIPEEFSFHNIPDGVGYETDKGIFTYDRDSDVFYNRETDNYLEMDGDFDSALTYAVRYGSPEKAIQAIELGIVTYAEHTKNFLQENAKDWTFVFDVHNDRSEILRGKEAKEKILDTIAKQEEFDRRYYAILNIDLDKKPKTNLEKLQQFCKKARMKDFDYVVGGVKMFLLDSPNVKLEQMGKLIDAVAPDAVYNKQYTEILKMRVRNNKEFQAKLADNKKSVSAKGR